MGKIQPDNRPIGQNCYLLCEKFEYNNGDYCVEIPEGFINDGASVPRWAWSIVGLTPDGLLRAAAIVHDFHYRFGIGTRKFADQLFYSMLIEYGVNKVRAKLAYAAVRIGGGNHFGKVVPPKSDDPAKLRVVVKSYFETGLISEGAYRHALEMISYFKS